MLKIASFNVNSINARLGSFKDWARDSKPDIITLQEIKCETAKFPEDEMRELGYRSYVNGQKSYNGVAILSRKELSGVAAELPGFPSGQARLISAEISPRTILINVYVPNGNPPEKDPLNTEKLEFKLQWLEALKKHIAKLMHEGMEVIIVGDWNVIIEERDVYNPAAYKNNALFLPRVREAYRKIENLGLINIIKSTLQPQSEEALYSFWDYQFQAWRKNYGMLIDHILMSPALAQKVKSCGIDKEERAKERPSDHVPIWANLSL